jgi:signal peptidase II
MTDTNAETTAKISGSGNMLRLGLGIAFATLIADQLHKSWMISIYGIKLEERINITPFMDFVYVINKGVSYGMFTQGSQTGQYILSAFALCVAVALVFWLSKSPHTRAAAIGIGFIMGGAVGNGIDRLHLGGVADFIQLHAFDFYWYVFNIADVAIVAGVIALLYDSLMASRKDAAKQP